MNLSNLKPSPGATKNKKRVGRGPGSGHGKQSGVGAKGQKGSSGYKSKAYKEGGQMPLQRRIPKRGFRNPYHIFYQEINVGDLAKLDVQEIDLAVLSEKGFLARKSLPVKILGDGQLEKALTVKAHAFSASAREKIEKAGGKIEIISKSAISGSKE